MESAAISALLPKLATMLTDEYKLHTGVKAGVRYLQDELTSMHATLESLSSSSPATAGGAHPDEPLLRPWKRKVRELAYDAEDTIDKHLILVSTTPPPELSRRPWTAAALHAARRFKARRRIAGEIERIKNDVKEASERRRRFSIVPASPPLPASSSSSSPVTPIDPRLHLRYENAARLVGMGAATTELTRKLSLEGGGGHRLKVVAVVGAGGIGKTTLAWEVYDKFREKFDCGAFVPVSQRPNRRFVLGMILRQVSQGSGENHESCMGEQEMIERIRDVLVDKRYFIVIDDVWDESVWNCINCALVQNTHGSKVLTTTRKSDIARLCRSTDSVDATILELQPLSFLDAQNLFYNKVFGEDRCPSEFTHISDQFLRKCAGLPLAIVTIASLLTNKHTTDEWSSVYNSISAEHNSHLEDMRWILSLSYHDLPSKLKPCLLYLSLFPEDHKIEKDDLIWRWIGEGFVHAKQDMSLHKVGEDYFNELINRSLVQPVHVDAHGRVQACRVHDIVLDYITNLSVEENFVTINGQHTQAQLLPNKIRRLSLRKSNENIISQETKNLFHVRSLAVFGHIADLMLPFPSFQVLRVLDLEDCSGHKIEDICNLVHLRYLRLSGVHRVEVPKQIGNLQFLQTLDLKKTKTNALPSTLVQLRRLARLCVDRLTQLPEGIGSMPSLEELSEVDISKYPNLMDGLGKLCKLRVLKMSLDTWDRRHREPLLKCLCNLKQLQTLHILAADVSLDFMLGNDWSWTRPHLQRLTVGIAGQSEHIFSLNPSSVWSEFSPFVRLPNWIKPSLNNLSELSIVVNTLPRKDLEVLGALPALCSLDLHIIKACAKHRMDIFDKSADNAVQFRCLANFKLVSRASGLVFRNKAMQRLRVLSLSFSVAETKYVHGDFSLGLEKLTTLKAVDIGIDCRCATLREVQHAEAMIRNSINSNPSQPSLDLRRHFERDSPWDIAREIPEPDMIMQELAGVPKIGLWGGTRGRLHGISVAPHNLRSVIIRSGLIIDSLAFTYYDRSGQEKTAGPWGGSGGSEHTIHLDPGEFLCKISGTIGAFGSLPSVVTSLKFTTNICSRGPFGQERGQPFDIPVQRNGCIVGFFARAEWYVDAIGVYVDPREDEEAGLAKFGPWGGDGGRSQDICAAPYRLQSVTIRSCFVIDSLAFSYIDRDGQHHSSGHWGGHGGACNTVLLGPSEFLTGISGTIDSYEDHSDVITSIMLVTNARTYGPFGRRQGTPFQVPLQSNGCIVGFFGRADQYLNAIGVYTNHNLEIMQQEEVGVARIGPWGGDGGRSYDIDATPHHLESVTICSCIVIDSIAFSFRDHNDRLHHAGQWGGCGGYDHKIQLEPSESVVELYGTIGTFNGIPNVVTSLTLVTSRAHRYGPYGTEEGTAFHIPVRSNGSIVGFFAQACEYIRAIGVYVRTP